MPAKNVMKTCRSRVSKAPPIHNVAYLLHARKVERQNQPFLSNTRTNNGTVGLRNPFLGYGLVNTLPRRRITSHSNSTGWESLGPEKGYLARTSSVYKRQTRPLVREDAPQKQDPNCQGIINIWS
jgi:hypothetical protein